MPKIKKRYYPLLQTYQDIKEDNFNFGSIASFFNSADKSAYRQTISQNTWDDLDMDELFMVLDRTNSKVGQQYFYYTLRNIPKDGQRSAKTEEINEFFAANKDIKDHTIIDFSQLNNPSASYIKTLIYGDHIKKPKWYWAVKMSPILTVGLLLFTIFLSPIFFFPLLLILMVNSILHYWNKNNVRRYSNAIPQLLKLHKVAKKIHHNKVPNSFSDELGEVITVMSGIQKRAAIFNLEAYSQTELEQVADIFMEVIKMLFLLEPIFLFKILGELEHKRKEILIAFSAVGEIDTAISINSYRNSLAYYTKPIFTETRKGLAVKEIYHPLLPDPVANTLEISDEKSLLISGSNMSGKTTFIRTIGINVLLAQTINTVLAENFTLPPINIHSTIRISDDLLDDKSYYQKEVLTIKELVAESEKEHQCLFLLDELYKGTNTVERVAAGKAVLSYLNSKENLVFASTHDLELTDYLNETFSYYHFTEVIEDNTLSFDYCLKPGRLTNTNAIRILEINDYPSSIISEAREISASMHQKAQNQD